MPLNKEIAGARRLLRNSRGAIAEVAAAGAATYIKQTPPNKVDRDTFYPNPRTHPYTVAFSASYSLPVDFPLRVPGYPKVFVASTNTENIDRPWWLSVPSKDIVVVSFRISGVKNHSDLDPQVGISTLGEALGLYQPVNSIPPRKGRRMNSEAVLLDLRQRTAAGLVVAEFVAATLAEAHGISLVPANRLEEVKEKLDKKVPFDQIPLPQGIAILGQQTDQLANS